jgi:hypothetical protein
MILPAACVARLLKQSEEHVSGESRYRLASDALLERAALLMITRRTDSLGRWLPLRLLLMLILVVKGVESFHCGRARLDWARGREVGCPTTQIGRALVDD